jgi:hypothetical protein
MKHSHVVAPFDDAGASVVVMHDHTGPALHGHREIGLGATVVTGADMVLARVKAHSHMLGKFAEMPATGDVPDAWYEPRARHEAGDPVDLAAHPRLGRTPAAQDLRAFLNA